MEKRAMCFVCRLSFNTCQPNGVFFGNDVSRMRKQECAETISNLLLGSCTHPLNIYFQSAAYCVRCTKILLDVNFSWKQLTALENRINHSLKVLRILFRKNFEGIPNKVEIDIPEVDPENLQEWESFTYDEVIQICMKVMHVEDAESILHPDQMQTVDPNDFLKAHFDAVNDEEDYFYLNSFEGKVKENELLGNLVGSSDRIQVYAKDDDTDSSFEMSSDDTDSSSYCSSNSGGKPKRKIRKKTTLQNPNNPNAPPGDSVATNIQGTTPNGLLPTSVTGIANLEQTVATPGTTSIPQIKKPIGGLPIAIASINQFVSSEFLKKFPIPVDKNKIIETKAVPAPVAAAPSVVAKPPELPLISSVKAEPANNENETKPPANIAEDHKPPTNIVEDHKPPTNIAEDHKPPETNVPQISVKSVLNSTMIPVINFKPKPVPVPTNPPSETVEPPAEVVKPNSETVKPHSTLNIPSSSNNFTRHTTSTVNRPNVAGYSRKPGPARMTMPLNYPRHNSSHFPTASTTNRPGPASITKRMVPRGNFKSAQRSRLPRTKNNVKKKRKGGHDSDVLSCSSFSSGSISSDSDLDSSSGDNRKYRPLPRPHHKSLPKIQKHKNKSGNCSSGSSIVVISD